MAISERAKRIEAVRRFSRFYTRRIGVLQEGLLGSPFSLAEGRVLFEIANRKTPTATVLCKALDLDPGYLSRILRRLDRRGLIRRRPSKRDARQAELSLTSDGRRAFSEINARSREQIGAILDTLPPADQARAVDAMRAVEGILGDPPTGRTPYVLRPHRPGDIGWVVGRHGALYAEEYGWDATFEALVAEIAAQFLRNYDPNRERCWIAERDGENIGCVFLVRESDDVARLRMLLVEPGARGLGIGRRLVEECIDFACRADYRQLTLWTNDNLIAARKIYQDFGFRLVAEAPHHSFGKDLVGQDWTLEL